MNIEHSLNGEKKKKQIELNSARHDHICMFNVFYSAEYDV